MELYHLIAKDKKTGVEKMRSTEAMPFEEAKKLLWAHIEGGELYFHHFIVPEHYVVENGLQEPERKQDPIKLYVVYDSKKSAA